MPRKMTFYTLMAGKDSETWQKGQGPNQSCHAVKTQTSQEIKQIHVWLSHPQIIQGSP